MRLSNIVNEVCAPQRGVRPGFDGRHVLKALLLIYEREPIGRITLSKLLGIGETSVRTLIRRFRALGLVEVDAVGGCFLTERGKILAEKFRRYVRRIEDVSALMGDDLRLDSVALAALVDSRLVDSFHPMTIRDTFVRNGASACIVARYRGGKLVLPPEDVGEERFPSLSRLREALEIEEGTGLIVVYAPTYDGAEKATYLGLAMLVDALEY